MFDSPFDWCAVCSEMVLLDQRQAECSGEHRCPDHTACPLAEEFCGIDFTAEPPKGEADGQRP